MLLFHTVCMVVIYFYLYPKDFPLSVWTMIIFFSVLVLPGILVHVEYHWNGAGKTITVLDDSMNVEEDYVQRTWLKSDIRLIQLFKGASTDAGGMPLLGIEHYYYARFWFKEGEYVDITCLQCRDIYAMLALFEGIRIERKKVLFNSLYLNTIFHTPEGQILDA
jgi:hypothetical protein